MNLTIWARPKSKTCIPKGKIKHHWLFHTGVIHKNDGNYLHYFRLTCQSCIHQVYSLDAHRFSSHPHLDHLVRTFIQSIFVIYIHQPQPQLYRLSFCKLNYIWTKHNNNQLTIPHWPSIWAQTFVSVIIEKFVFNLKFPYEALLIFSKGLEIAQKHFLINKTWICGLYYCSEVAAVERLIKHEFVASIIAVRWLLSRG